MLAIEVEQLKQTIAMQSEQLKIKDEQLKLSLTATKESVIVNKKDTITTNSTLSFLKQVQLCCSHSKVLHELVNSKCLDSNSNYKYSKRSSNKSCNISNCKSLENLSNESDSDNSAYTKLKKSKNIKIKIKK